MHQEPRMPRPIESTVEAGSPVDATFVPYRYEPNYPYPLLVLLHSRGGDEQQLVNAMPTMSWRNYVGLGLRGPEPVTRSGRPAGHGWGPAFRHPLRRPGPVWDDLDPLRTLGRVMQGGAADEFDLIDDAVCNAVRRTRCALHVHSERIFLVGSGEGAAVAYRLGLTYPERFAGVIAFNGWLPRGFAPLARWRACRSLRILALHGLWNARAPYNDARRDVDLLRNAGLRVTSRNYGAAHAITPPMLSDADSWLIDQCTSTID